MKKFLAFSLSYLLVAPGCTGIKINPNPTPTPTPKPTPSPTGVVNPEMVLFRNGQQIVDLHGTPIQFRGWKDCCKTEEGEPEPMWPLGSKDRNAWLKLNGDINFVGNRLGPWRAIPGDQPTVLALGGGYLEVNGKADLTQWNPKFWDYNDQLASDNATRGQWEQVGVYDGWAAKGHCFAGGNPGYHPFLPDNNVQGEDHCNFNLDPVQETWIRKVVDVMGRHGNVTWEICNECNLAPGWTTAWEEKVIAVIKDEETKKGYPHHLIATNAQTNVMTADWNEYHTEGQPVLFGDKITGVNEYNPEPPLSGVKLLENYCASVAANKYYWGWSHEMSLSDRLFALDGMKKGCTNVGCSIPASEVPLVASKNPPVGTRPGSGKQIDDRNAFIDAAQAAVAAVHPEMFDENGNLVGWPSDGAKQAAFAVTYLTLLQNYFRSQGACASAWEDSVAVGWKGDGWFEENHVLNFGPGHPIQGRNAWQYTWEFPK